MRQKRESGLRGSRIKKKKSQTWVIGQNIELGWKECGQ